nr:hypothetical protein [Tanacetum cinerariifolium]
MEQYMSKTRADYGSGIARPNIEDNDSFELKGQFRKELRDNTFSGLDHKDANEHTEKVFEIVDLFHIPNITIDQVMLRAFPMSLNGAARASISVMPPSTYLSLGLGELAHTKLTVELADRTVKYPKGIAKNMLVDFAVLEDMDGYRDEGMGNVIFGEPFLREIKINAKWIEGMITIHNGNKEVTYQMVRSHLRFKHHTYEQCNKIPLLLNVSEEDKMDKIAHSYQKLRVSIRES